MWQWRKGGQKMSKIAWRHLCTTPLLIHPVESTPEFVWRRFCFKEWCRALDYLPTLFLSLEFTTTLRANLIKLVDKIQFFKPQVTYTYERSVYKWRHINFGSPQMSSSRVLFIKYLPSPTFGCGVIYERLLYFRK